MLKGQRAMMTGDGRNLELPSVRRFFASKHGTGGFSQKPADRMPKENGMLMKCLNKAE